jgi:hypothetical protein
MRRDNNELQHLFEQAEHLAIGAVRVDLELECKGAEWQHRIGSVDLHHHGRNPLSLAETEDGLAQHAETRVIELARPVVGVCHCEQPVG